MILSDKNAWPHDGGEMGDRIREYDWSRTGLGRIETWPPYLKSAIEILLHLPIPAAFFWGSDGITLYNDAFVTFTEQPHPAPLGQSIIEAWPEHAGFNRYALDRVLAGESFSFQDQEFTRRRNGVAEPAWLNLNYASVVDEKGKPVGMLTICIETTRHILAQRALHDSQQRLSSIFVRAQVGLSEISLDGRFIRVNDELCKLLGRSSESLLTLNVPDVTHVDDVGRSIAGLKSLLETGEPVSLEKRYIRVDGSTVWANSRLSRLDDEQGKPTSVLAVTVDFTVRKLAEEALAESEARFRALAEASPALIWQLAPDGKAVYMNPRYLELVGAATQDEVLGTGWHSYLHPADAEDCKHAIEEAQRSRVAVQRRGRMRGASGEWHWLELHASPWFTAENQYAGHVGISIDITDTVNAQEELLVSNERLKLAIEGSGDGIWDWDIQTGELVISEKSREMIGLGPSDAFSRIEHWESRVHPEDRPNVQSVLKACFTGTSSSFRSEYRIHARNAGWKWILSRGIVVARDAGNQPLRMTGTMTDISEKRRSEEVIWLHANFDALTGLPNRRLFRDRLDHEVRKAHRTGMPLALLFIDLDRFKEANDLLGHEIGDHLLVEAAKRISGCVRESDTVARLGGDEFTAILTELEDIANVEIVARKINERLALPFSLSNEVVYLSASIGVTLYPSDASRPDDLIRNADQAMYVAKNAGRNQFSFFTSSMQKQAHERLRLIRDLRSAIERNQLKVYYQPVVDLSTGKVVKAEALLRWQHPKLGMIDPLRFIPFAEESGLINEIGDWVFCQAAASSQRWSTRLGKPFQISVNKSPVQFLSRVRQVNWPQYLHDLGLPGSSVSVEITEGLLLNASDRVVDELLQYRDAGMQVAIDDFGTGYSSMAYLQKFDIDYLKIDRSFVSDVATDEGSRAIVRSVTAMAHELGLQVIAEGIETPEQQALLVEARCDFGQGFLFSHAVPAEEFERILH